MTFRRVLVSFPSPSPQALTLSGVGAGLFLSYQRETALARKRCRPGVISLSTEKQNASGVGGYFGSERDRLGGRPAARKHISSFMYAYMHADIYVYVDKPHGFERERTSPPATT